MRRSACSLQARPHLAKLLGKLAGERAGRVHKCDNWEAKVVSVAHEPKRFAVAVGLGHAKVAMDVFLWDAQIVGKTKAE